MSPALKSQDLSRELPLSEQTGDLANTAEILKEKYRQVWWETEAFFPEFSERYAHKRKREIEAETTALLDRLTDEQNLTKSNDLKIDPGMQEVLKKEESNIEKLCHLAGLYIDKNFSTGFDRATKIFMKKVKQFDPSLKPENIYQAMRNVWIMNSLQVLMNQKMGCSDSIFAYSMLYPYSDNVNDDVDKSVAAKFSMNQNFKKWLEGDHCPYQNENEHKIYRLVKMIEAEFPRDHYPGVFQSLLLIYNAQIRSLVQQKQNLNSGEIDILDISLEKGGASVVADGYLINGAINEDQADFCFGYGAFLQFADDIQDLETDGNNGHVTLFTREAANGHLDAMANKLFHFIATVVDLHLSATHHQRLKELILRNCNFMFLEAIIKNRKFYSRKYMDQIEQHFPFSFSYYQKVKKRLKQMLLKVKSLDNQ